MNRKNFRRLYGLLLILSVMGPFALMFAKSYLSWILGIDLDKLEYDVGYSYVYRPILAANAMRLLAFFAVASFALLSASTFSLAIQHRELLPRWVSILASIFSLTILVLYGLAYMLSKLAGARCC